MVVPLFLFFLLLRVEGGVGCGLRGAGKLGLGLGGGIGGAGGGLIGVSSSIGEFSKSVPLSRSSNDILDFKA